jgi:hypothetical protein
MCAVFVSNTMFEFLQPFQCHLQKVRFLIFLGPGELKSLSYSVGFHFYFYIQCFMVIFHTELTFHITVSTIWKDAREEFHF